jgi:CheY-like chemotaxis protein
MSSQHPARRAVVLAVDDEAAIRQLVRHILERYRYEVVEASSGEHALDLVKDRPRLDIVIADLVIPGLQGDEMVQRICAQRPDLKVLYLTGHADRLFDRLGTLPTGHACNSARTVVPTMGLFGVSGDDDVHGRLENSACA